MTRSLHVIIRHVDVKEFWPIWHFVFLLALGLGLLLKNLQPQMTEHMSQSGESCLRVLPESSHFSAYRGGGKDKGTENGITSSYPPVGHVHSSRAEVSSKEGRRGVHEERDGVGMQKDEGGTVEAGRGSNGWLQR